MITSLLSQTLLICAVLRYVVADTCSNLDAELFQVQGLTCNQISSSLCANTFYAGFCPLKCGLCDLPCLDDPPEGLTCIEEECATSPAQRLYCPITCKTAKCTTECADDNDGLTKIAGANCAAFSGMCDSNALVAGYCPVTCNLCERSCADQPLALQDVGLPECTAEGCTDAILGSTYKWFCPNTCMQCVAGASPSPSPTPWACLDLNDKLMSTQGYNCTDVKKDGLCTNVFLSAYCPQTCALCNAPCDNLDLVVATAIPGSDCSFSDYCTHPTYAPVFNIFCRITCSGCSRSPTPSLSRSASPSRSIRPSPSPGALPCADHEDTLATAVNSPGSCGNVVSLGLCGLYSPYCQIACNVCGRECVNNGDTSFNCSSPFLQCDDDAVGFLVHYHCPIKCGDCVPSPSPSASPRPSPTTGAFTCNDHNDYAQSYIGMSCEEIVAGNLCSKSPQYTGYCPVSCSACVRPCEDDDSQLQSGYLGGCSAHACENIFLGPMYQYYCPVTCGMCSDSQSVFGSCSQSSLPLKFLYHSNFTANSALANLCIST